MQQVIRALQGRRQRELQRTKIKQITPQQLFNNIRYHNQQLSPHKVLRHQYQHLHNHSYNDLQRLSQRKLYPLSHVFAYEPLRVNQIEEQKRRSKSISEANQFLRHYDPNKYEQKKNDFNLRWKTKKEGQNQSRAAKNQLGIKKDDQRSNIFSRMKESGYSQQSSLHIPQKKSQLYIKARAASLAAYFCVIVKRRLRRLILKRKEKCVQYGKLYVQEACFSMQTYYYKLLQQEITQYILLLEKINRYPSYNADQDILRILSFMLSKLSSSPIPKSLLSSLEVIGINHAFFNFAFLFQSVAVRLQFSKEWGCLVNVGKDESLMIAATLMGIVMLCFNLLYRPWLAEGLFRKIQKREFNIRQKYYRIKRTIQSMASLVYFLVIDNFIFPIEPFERNYYQFSIFLKDKKIEIVKSMTVTPKEKAEESEEQQIDSELQDNNQQSVRTNQSFTPNVMFRDKTNIIAGQNRQFYEKMKGSYPMEMEIISDHLSTWITKATLAALAEAEEARKERVHKFIGKNKGKP